MPKDAPWQDNRTVNPTPCLRCKSDVPLTIRPRLESFFYTACLSFDGASLATTVGHQPRGRLCEECTSDFVGWLAVGRRG